MKPSLALSVCAVMVMRPSQSQINILLLWILCALMYNSTIGMWGLKIQCNETDRQKLLSFKEQVIDSSGMLSSWSDKQDCCRWAGVDCDNLTYEVTNLSLPCYFEDDTECLAGEFSLSNLLALEFLNYLDLSGHNLLFTPPRCSRNCSSKLLYLDLSLNDPKYELDDLTWLIHFHSLEYLFLDGISLRKSRWLQSMNKLPSLLELHLSNCQLRDINPYLEFVNFTSLQVLDLSANNFQSDKLPKWLFNLSHIWNLDLSENSFQDCLPETILNLQNLISLRLFRNELDGPIPNSLGQLENLQYLYLFDNFFVGSVPKTFGNLSFLIELLVSDNLLNGSLPENLALLSNLETLDVGNNFLTGNISEKNFLQLSNLQDLSLGSPALTFHFDPRWIPSFQLQSVHLTYVQPKLPEWLYTQKSLQSLAICNSSLSLADQDRFWNFVAEVELYFKLWYNSISGDWSKVFLNTRVIWWRGNNLTGGLPQISPNVTIFLLESNSISGSLSSLLCQMMDGQSKLSYLHISYTPLSGGLTECWMNLKSLVHIGLFNNSLTGKIPESMSSLYNLRSLHLCQNNLFGHVPTSLQNCQKLGILNLGENKFSGNVPYWISPSVNILLLRSNQFSGNIHPQLCQLSSLGVLDIANNRLSGRIPGCLDNIISMVSHNSSYSSILIEAAGTQFIFYFSFEMLIKANQLSYWSTQELICSIDFSNNNLIGTIPSNIFTLAALQSLNLSNNELMGRIPDEIGNLKKLESLDLSSNKFSGEIPQSMSELSFLGFLNLSFNNLRGQIPQMAQLQRFDALSYIANPQLCGPPLTKPCTSEKPNLTEPVEENDENEYLSWFYIGMGVGFAVGFWGVCASLFFNRTWRHAYFRFLHILTIQLYVCVVYKMNIFRRI